MDYCIESPSGSLAKSKDAFISQAHEAREARDLKRKREKSATKIQAFIKSAHTRKQLKKSATSNFEKIASADTLPDASELQQALREVIFNCNTCRDRAIIDKLLQYVRCTANLTTDAATANKPIDTSGTQKSVNDDAQVELTPIENESDRPQEESTAIRKNLMCLIVDNIVRDEKCHEQWVRCLESILNLSLNYLKDANSSMLDSQHIDTYLSLVSTFISTKKLISILERCEQSWPPTGHNLETRRDIAAKIATELLNRTLIHRKKFLKLVTSLICERIDRFRNDLKSSILNSYTSIVIELLQHQISSDESNEKNTLDILVKMLCIPGFVQYLTKYTPESLEVINDAELFAKIVRLMAKDAELQDLKSIPALCLLANITNLAQLNESHLKQHVESFVSTVTKLLELCQKNMLQISSAIMSGNPRLIKGYVNSRLKSEPLDVTFNAVLGWLTKEQSSNFDKTLIKTQLSHLWSLKFMKILFDDLVKLNEAHKSGADADADNTCQPASLTSPRHKRNIFAASPRSFFSESLTASPTSGMIKRAVERAASTVSKSIGTTYSKSTSNSTSSGSAKLMTPEVQRIAAVCNMLYMTSKTMTTLKQDVLTGLCLHDFLLQNLWSFISSLSANNGLKAFLEHLTIYSKTNAPEFAILTLFCECASHLISILDDTELYERQKPFSIEDLVAISSFLNNFVFRIIWNNLIPLQQETNVQAPQNQHEQDPVLQTTHKLLTDLYKRDCRRRFTTPDHWLIKDIKISLFLKDLAAGKPVAQAIMTMLPHIIPHKERVMIFRKLVAQDKALHCQGSSMFITIHRTRIVEDGYQQLAKASATQALKGSIRVKFINDFGLDEAGLDQDGVFKEFLEETIKRVFDPTLNLFCSTSEQRLYPSPTSCMHENYLSLFNFVGKMLGKAVYEGIVVDVPFATFFLSRVLGQAQSPLYSPIDELPSLDPELYKSLTYIKHYEGDVSELDLTFSIDQDFMGKIQTYELELGGKSIPVTRESRIRYIHSVANFRMKTQIEKQTEAFISGFKSIIKPEWLSMFSATELQRLISGDNTPIDLQDLRRHTKYFGGFHNNHRVVSWLWDILEKDFTSEEHKLFLKFVTSCSKPPLLGFANLEPPFSIRCVEVSDDQDLGDTFGSMLRTFLAIRRSDPVDRLPTSSTCFNLLKLPNYQRRSTLRDKLRYAIRSNPGFELS